MADLEALAKTSSWQQLLEHAEDIPPTQRGERWNKLVEDAGTGLLAGLDAEKVSWQGLATADALTRRFPSLKASRAFMTRRADVGLRAFQRCFELAGDDSPEGQACAERLVGFADGDGDTALAQRSIAMMEAHLHDSTAVALPLYARLFEKNGAKDCASTGAKKAVISALALDKADARVAQARDIASRLCWSQMQDALVDAIGQPHVGAHYFENACGFMVEKKALGNLSTNRCKALQK